MTEPEPTPVFRRFPWVQLVFCLACLTMSGYAWMRYSYRWDVVPGDLWDMPIKKDRGSRARPNGKLAQGYVRLRGRSVRPMGSNYSFYVISDELRPICTVFLNYRPGDRYFSEGANLELDGRLVDTQGFPTLELFASRFHGGSIAGLVVGAMGCFIFGLYLRRWLRERKALACQPVQDMIA